MVGTKGHRGGRRVPFNLGLNVPSLRSPWRALLETSRREGYRVRRYLARGGLAGATLAFKLAASHSKNFSPRKLVGRASRVDEHARQQEPDDDEAT